MARSIVVSVVPGSACRPFLLDKEVALEAEDSVCEWEPVRFLGGGLGVGFSELV